MLKQNSPNTHRAQFAAAYAHLHVAMGIPHSPTRVDRAHGRLPAPSLQGLTGHGTQRGAVGRELQTVTGQLLVWG